jgi:acyl-CoA synthetase (AMP-forming)/AMP-acid ligase II
VKAKLINPQGETVPIGAPGEICVSGYLIQKGLVEALQWEKIFYLCNRYWGDEQQARSVMHRDNDSTLWMHTGDEGILDQEGYLRSKTHVRLLLYVIDVLL